MVSFHIFLFQKFDDRLTFIFLQDVLDSLQAKLGLKAVLHFSLVVEHVKSLKRNKLTLLNPRDTLAKVCQTNLKGKRTATSVKTMLSLVKQSRVYNLLITLSEMICGQLHQIEWGFRGRKLGTRKKSNTQD